MFLAHIYDFWCTFLVSNIMANVEIDPYLDPFGCFLHFAIYGVLSCQLQGCDHHPGFLHCCLPLFIPFVSLNTFA